MTTTNNTDAKLMKLASAYAKGNWRTRRLYRGKAMKLIDDCYPVNRNAISAEWQALATRLARNETAL